MKLISVFAVVAVDDELSAAQREAECVSMEHAALALWRFVERDQKRAPSGNAGISFGLIAFIVSASRFRNGPYPIPRRTVKQ